ncbi:PaaI family thioesterase [Gordonia sp. DT30]|uniref:PaaI family thioesterase n=1 Tax=Gordonia sp. DT30 TaxID=3416546 RepID=UPI003CEC250B
MSRTEMSRTETAAEDPLSVFHVGGLTVSGTTARAQQQLCTRSADHRGRIDLPALGVLFDHIGGAAFYQVGLEAGAMSMQARLQMSTLGHASVDDRLICDTELAMHDERTGVTTVAIRTESGRVCCVGTARNIRVGRGTADTTRPARLADAPDCADVPNCTDAHGIRLPDPLPSNLDGREIIAQIAAGTRDPGPLATLLNGVVELRAEGGIRLTVTTEPWMGNIFGTMHGGVIVTIVGQAFSFAGQAQAGAGRDYHVADMSIGFFRSPTVQGGPVTVEVTPTKAGRRISAFAARMTAHDGTLLSDGTADIHFR